MTDYLILRLSGPMQAWGMQTFEGIRPSAAFPTRSGLLGVLGACLGLARNNKVALQALSDSVRFAVRCDETTPENQPLRCVNLADFHTVQQAREDYEGLKSHDTILTRREYLYDACFTVALWVVETGTYTLECLHQAAIKPHYTPYLGRRSCPLTRPLVVGLSQANTPLAALQQTAPGMGVFYSEEPFSTEMTRCYTRDQPLYHLPRQFALREWYVLPKEPAYVPE